MPADEPDRKELQKLDPYELRARGLDEQLSPHELGRAIYHLARKRGFRSSRKDRGDTEREKETGKVTEAIKALEDRIRTAGCRTVGEYLAQQHAERSPVRARRSSDGGYVLYLQRAMVEREFDSLWEAQRKHHPELLTDQLQRTLRETILFQRRLRPVMPGRCQFERDEYRAPLCSPLQQRFRMLQELNNLRVREGIGQRPLTLGERNAMLELLGAEAKQASFSALAKAAGLRNAKSFNLESEKRKGLKGDAVAASFADPDALGDQWFELTPEQQEGLALLVQRADQHDRLVEALLALPENLSEVEYLARPHPHEREFIAGMAKLPFKLSSAQAERIAGIVLPDDYGSLSRKALQKIIPALEADVVTYDVAVQNAGYAHHSAFHTGEIFDRLPYYGEILQGYTSPTPTAKNDDERLWGKIANPTVHIGLNQLRQLVNALAKRFGPPAEIIVELAREFGLSGQRRREIQREQADNQARNEEYGAELRRLGRTPTRVNREKLRLWEELGADDAMVRDCVYSGTQISKAMLFSDEIEMDHILPFSKSLHDGIGNKVLCTRAANRAKGNKTPFEAFGHSPSGYSWEAIEERAAHLPGRKALLFRENALDEFLGERSFLDRHITDTAYLSRVAKQYLSYICHKDKVWVSSGRLTAMLRGRWGLNSLLSDDNRKNRDDHRHHALDAAVVGQCSRSTIQRLATAASRAESMGENRLLAELEPPWPTFREDLGAVLNKVVVSHRPDHGTEGSLHNETNYGLRGPEDKRGNPLLAHFVPIESLSSVADLQKLADANLQSRLTTLLSPLSSGKEVKAALLAYSQQTGIRRVQLHERLKAIAIHDRRTGAAYRYVKGDANYCYDIFELENGKWTGEIVTVFEANQPGFDLRRAPDVQGRRFMFRLRKDDLLALEIDQNRVVYRVVKISAGIIALAPHCESNVDARDRAKADPFNYLRVAPSRLGPLRARVVGVDVLGYVNDPGFKGQS